MGEQNRIEPLLTSEEAAAILKIHPRVLERMAKRGEVPGFKLGKFWRYRTSDLESWIESKVTKDRQPSDSNGLP